MNYRQSRTTWHKQYFKGRNFRQSQSDYLERYYTDTGEYIIVVYTDFTHKKVLGYYGYNRYNSLHQRVVEGIQLLEVKLEVERYIKASN